MGAFLARAIDRLSMGAPKDSRILMVGLDAAGKTSILYKIKRDENILHIRGGGHSWGTTFLFCSVHSRIRRILDTSRHRAGVTLALRAA